MAFVRELKEISRSFGPGPEEEKLRLFDAVMGQRNLSTRELTGLTETLCFMRAYPDSPRVLRAVREVAEGVREFVDPDDPDLMDTGVPGSANSYPYSYGVLQRMVALHPGRLEIDWEVVDDLHPLHTALVLLLTVGEHQGLDDTSMTMPEWIERCKPDAGETDLEFVLRLFHRDHLSKEEQAYLFESCHLSVRYDLADPGTGRCEIALEEGRVHYQRGPIDRPKFDLRPVIRRPLKKPERGGQTTIDLSLDALCVRNLEIAPLIYADENDVLLADAGRGLTIALVGVLPDYRDPLESSFFFLVTKNGVPVAYGPASVCFSCCEMGINLFPEFRGGEIRLIYAQFMRVLHHVLGVRYFFLTRYGMGESNEEALRSGAFWFYRGLGFLPTNSAVEALAREEEKRMRAKPGYRSDLSTLKKLSHTEAYFDLSDGTRRPVDLGGLGVAQSRAIEERFGGDRALAEKRLAQRAARLLKIQDLSEWSAHERRALRIFAPILSLDPGLSKWSARARAGMVRIIRTKGSRSEQRVDRLMDAHKELRAIVGSARRDER